MEIKLKLDTEKAAKATVAIACTYVLACVSEASASPQLAAANALELIITITILYGRGLLAHPVRSLGTRTAGITVGRMDIGSAKSTRVPPASTKRQVTKMTPLARTRWGAARMIRGGTSLAPDMEGWQMRSIV